jgi:hypothetical protein
VAQVERGARSSIASSEVLPVGSPEENWHFFGATAWLAEDFAPADQNFAPAKFGHQFLQSLSKTHRLTRSEWLTFVVGFGRFTCRSWLFPDKHSDALTHLKSFQVLWNSSTTQSVKSPVVGSL